VKDAGAKVYEIMTDRVKDIQDKLGVVSKYRKQVQEILQAATKKREELDGEIDTKTAELRTEEAKLGSMLATSEDYAKQAALVADLQAEVTLLTGNRNKCLGVQQTESQDAERQLRLQEQLIKQLTGHDTYRAMLKAQMENNTVTLSGTLTVLKGANDQDAAQNVVTSTRGMIARMDTLREEADAAMDRGLAEMFEDFETWTERFWSTRQAGDEARAAITARMKVLKEKMENNFGEDMNAARNAKYPDATPTV